MTATRTIREILEAASESALRAIVEPRFYATERGFQGRFAAALIPLLVDAKVLNGSVVLEEEYQKKRRSHGIKQRPDLILHTPAMIPGRDVRANNFAVWAFKRRATQRSAQEDFAKLDEMFEALAYPVGFFINIDASNCHSRSYKGRHSQRIVCYAAKLEAGIPTIVSGRP